MPAIGITAPSVIRGTNMPIHIEGLEYGLRPNASYMAVIGSTPTGSLQTNSQGNISGTISVPISTQPGNQPVSVTGPGQNGDSIFGR
jgi:hypothetical protein